MNRILPAWEGPATPVYAMTETRLLPAKTQRFIEFLRERLSADPVPPGINGAYQDGAVSRDATGRSTAAPIAGA